jgi:DNA-binding NtrC family response regulator
MLIRNVTSMPMPRRILIIDDFFGRSMPAGSNPDRENLCAHFLLSDRTGDAAESASQQKVMMPVADAVFYRGQIPGVSGIGALVENDIPGSLEIVREGWHAALNEGRAPWAMVLLDLCFYTGEVTERSNRRTPGMPEGTLADEDPRNYFGLKLLDAIQREAPHLPVLIFSSKPRGEVSLEFSKRGALGFISRDDPRGPEVLEEALWQHGLWPDPEGRLIGNSLPVLLALREARRAARHRGNLLIRGERGSGKDLLASYIHHVGMPAQKRQNSPLVAVNSAGLSVALSSELFGIEPKTATGVAGKVGLIETADGGDLFLDEIADMPSEVQAAVLRVLQDGKITRIGGRDAKPVNVRFLSATNADLEDLLTGFRLDLLDRLRLGGTLWLPPLRERGADIPLLAETFLRTAEASSEGAMRRELTPEALALLKSHEWPGNIRELRACIFDAVNRHPDVEYLVPGHLRIAESDRAKKHHPPPVHSTAARGSQELVAGPIDLDTLLEMQRRLRFDPQAVVRWSGRLGDLQNMQAWVSARYLLAALEATKRRTPAHPDGVLRIHPAVKLLIGETALSTSKAADIIKRLLSPIESELAGDLLLAYSIATRLRPKSSTTNKRKANAASR